MTRFTERAIMDAFFELLVEKPLDKVTVADIAQRCGINRNTFYYHYHDVYDLLESLIDSELRKVMEASGGADDLTWDSFIEAGTHFLSEHRAFVFHIYESSHHAMSTRLRRSPCRATSIARRKVLRSTRPIARISSPSERSSSRAS